MASPGRGRGRGARYLEMVGSDLGLGHGKITSGRGVSDSSSRGKMAFGRGRPVLPNEELEPPRDNESNDLPKISARALLQQELIVFEKTGEGDFIRMALHFFADDDDVQYYIDKVMASILNSSKMVEKFTMSLKIITLMKIYGEDIKIKFFSKLQTTFEVMTTLMKDMTLLSEAEKTSTANFCDLMGQLYFRLRPQLSTSERYNVLAAPAAYCMKHLLSVKGAEELRILVKLIVLNYKTLYGQQQENMSQINFDIHTALLEGSDDLETRTLLLSAVDLIATKRSQLPPQLEQYYAKRLGVGWESVVVKSPAQLLADVPPDVAENKMDSFIVRLDEYNLHKFVEL